MMENSNRVLDYKVTDERIELYRQGRHQPLLVQHAGRGKRPYLHPLIAPDGYGVLTEDAPPHHPWQHGVYVGLNDVNGIGFWTESLTGNERDGSFRPKPPVLVWAELNRACWSIETDWLDPQGEAMLTEKQVWTVTDNGDTTALELVWTLKANRDIRFGAYSYGGLFVRMPYRGQTGGTAVNDSGLSNKAAEGQRARWVSVSMPIEGREDEAGIAVLDHPNNPEHPVPWRVDNEMGISPSRCIAGEWTLAEGKESVSGYKLLLFTGPTDPSWVDMHWNEYAGRNNQ